jgi:hypothetical protein
MKMKRLEATTIMLAYIRKPCAVGSVIISVKKILMLIKTIIIGEKINILMKTLYFGVNNTDAV